MKLRTSSSVGQFHKKAKKAWGLESWGGINDPDKQLVFFGLFHDRDFEVFHNFIGEKHVFWCGGDILRLLQDYERRRVLRISANTTHYCENETEAENLRKAGIEPKVIPSFLGDINDYPVSFKVPADGKWKIWMNAHPHREHEYGIDLARNLSKIFPDVEFHIYGVDKEYEGKVYNEADEFLTYHGLVNESVLDEEIRSYHAGFRANLHDGLSEIICKSALLGQAVISRLPYPHAWQFETLEDLIGLTGKLKEMKEPNYGARNYWVSALNKFPWVK